MTVPLRSWVVLSWFLLALSTITSPAQPTSSAEDDSPSANPPAAQTATANTLDTLDSFVNLRNSILQDITAINQQIGASQSDAEKQDLKTRLDELQSDLRAITQNFENIVAGIGITSLRAATEEDFNFQREVFALLKPALEEMKEMTSTVRRKSDLKEEISYHEERIPVIEQAIANTDRLMAQTEDESVTQALTVTRDKWQRKQAFMQSELEDAKLQLQELIDAEVSLTQASQSYLKSFFQQRGLYLTVAMLVVLAILLLSRLSHKALLRLVPGFRKLHRSFRIRLLELLHLVPFGRGNAWTSTACPGACNKSMSSAPWSTRLPN